MQTMTNTQRNQEDRDIVENNKEIFFIYVID